MNIRFYTHSLASKGHKELKKELKERGHTVLSIKKEGSRYLPRPSHYIINWGLARNPEWRGGNTLNMDIEALKIARDKKKFFESLSATHPSLLPVFTTTRDGAIDMLEQGPVYCRTLLTSSQGRGIVVARERGEVVSAPLYTGRIESRGEFRVHVFRGEVIDYAVKKKMRSERREEEGIELNEDVRNHNNGFVFARGGVDLPEPIKEGALSIMQGISLDFGAVDLIYNVYGHAKVLEINTAPGMVGTTVSKYADAIERWGQE